mmetsp:Transcript_2665/g.3996  ORF Transcript_2665/g.3996 Transcript_2665/m.3996 type:complete len:81 (-) Transcript_2665:365-607(-)
MHSPKNGKTYPLLIAALEGHHNVVKLFDGADMNTHLSYSFKRSLYLWLVDDTAVYTASQKGRLDAIRVYHEFDVPKPLPV